MKYKCPKCGKEFVITSLSAFDAQVWGCVARDCDGVAVAVYDEPAISDAAVVERFNELWDNKKITAMPIDTPSVCKFVLMKEEQPINKTVTGFQKNENDLWEEVRALRERLLDTQNRLEHLRSYVYQKVGGVE